MGIWVIEAKMLVHRPTVGIAGRSPRRSGPPRAAVPIISLLVKETRQFPGGFEAGFLAGRSGLLGRGLRSHRGRPLDWRLVLDRVGVNVQLGKEHRVGGGVARPEKSPVGRCGVYFLSYS